VRQRRREANGDPHEKAIRPGSPDAVADCPWRFAADAIDVRLGNSQVIGPVEQMATVIIGNTGSPMPRWAAAARSF
jgi:hypothetical protein